MSDSEPESLARKPQVNDAGKPVYTLGTSGRVASMCWLVGLMGVSLHLHQVLDSPRLCLLFSVIFVATVPLVAHSFVRANRRYASNPDATTWGKLLAGIATAGVLLILMGSVTLLLSFGRAVYPSQAESRLARERFFEEVRHGDETQAPP